MSRATAAEPVVLPMPWTGDEFLPGGYNHLTTQALIRLFLKRHELSDQNRKPVEAEMEKRLKQVLAGKSASAVFKLGKRSTRGTQVDPLRDPSMAMEYLRLVKIEKVKPGPALDMVCNAYVEYLGNSDARTVERAVKDWRDDKHFSIDCIKQYDEATRWQRYPPSPRAKKFSPDLEASLENDRLITLPPDPVRIKAKTRKKYKNAA